MKPVLFALAMAAFGSPLLAGDGGIIRKESAQGVAETVDALQATMQVAGLKIFARVNHGAGAKAVGEDIGASELLIFGSPKVGTPAMMDDPLSGLYLPLKVLVYEDTGGTTWIAYEDPEKSLAHLGGVSSDAPYLQVMKGALGKFSGYVAK